MTTPFHRRIYEEWREGILAGRYRGGDRVPSTRELAATLGVSRGTVTEAYQQLIAEGYLESSRGSGTFVCRELPDKLLRPRQLTAARPAEESPIELSRYGSGLDQDFRYPPVERGVISFAQWRPALDQFPFFLWRKLLNRHLRHAQATIFDYYDQAAGYQPLRIEIAAHLARSRAVRCSPEQVIVVNGSQQGIDLCCRLLLEAGDEVGFENPGYQGARRILEAHGAQIRPARIDSDGLVPGDLSKNVRVVYVTPSHQFPTGVSMSLARRLELIEWARQHRTVLIEDDYDSEYRYSGAPLPSLQGLSGGVPVIYIGTFSKVMFPGLRIGYLVVPRQLVAPFTRAKWLMDRHTTVLEQAVLTDFLGEGHLERHTRRMRRLYGERREVLVECTARNFGTHAVVSGDAAGMHVMIRFEDVDMLARSIRNRVQLISSSGYYLRDGPPNEFVFGFSALGERTIREGVKRLAQG